PEGSLALSSQVQAPDLVPLGIRQWQAVERPVLFVLTQRQANLAAIGQTRGYQQIHATVVLAGKAGLLPRHDAEIQLNAGADFRVEVELDRLVQGLHVSRQLDLPGTEAVSGHAQTMIAIAGAKGELAHPTGLACVDIN